MNCFLVSLILSYLAFSFGEELMMLPPLEQYCMVKGSTLNLTCRHYGTQSTQQYGMSFWWSNMQIVTDSFVSIQTFEIADTQDGGETRIIRTLVITKQDIHFSDAGKYICILGHNITNYKAEVEIDVRVLEIQSAEYEIPPENDYIVPSRRKKLILGCDTTLSSRDTSFTVDTKWLKVSEGKEQFLGNSSKYAIFTEENTLEIVNPVSEDAGEYRCVLVFNKECKSSYQEVRSQPFFVKVPPKIKTRDNYKDLIQNDTLELRCTASGFPKPTITWLKDGKVLNQTERIHPQGELLVIYNLGLGDMGAYECVASHSLFSFTDSATMIVNVTEKETKSVAAGGRGYMQDFPWVYFLLLCLLQCGSDVRLKLKLLSDRSGKDIRGIQIRLPRVECIFRELSIYWTLFFLKKF